MSLFIVQNLKLLRLKPYFDTPPLSQGSYAFRPLGLALHHQPCPLLVLLASPPLTGHLPCLLVGPCLLASLQGLPGSPAYWFWPPTSFPFTVYYPFHSPMCPSMFPIPLDTVSKMKNSLRISLYVPGSIHHQRQRSHHRNQSRLAASQWSLPQNAEFVHPRWCSSVETRGFGRH